MTLPAKNHDDDDAHGVLPVKMIWVGVDFDTARDFLEFRVPKSRHNVSMMFLVDYGTARIKF